MNPKSLLYIGMVLSFVVASMLNVYPLSYQLANIRPMFLAVSLAFWVMYRSGVMSVWAVFLVGVMSDLLLGTHLGHQAFCAVIMAFVIRVLLLSIKELQLMQAWIIAGLGLTVYQLMLWVLQSFSRNGFGELSMGALLTSLMVFPVFWWPLYWINGHFKERAY